MRQTFTASLCGGLALAMLAGASVAEAQIANRPKGGCLKYGAAGALAGHVVHHGVRGALLGCVAGMVVKHRSKKRFRETGQY